MSHDDRLSDMLERYGECCSQEKAARILGKCSRTIRRMLNDGRLSIVGAGVDVRSIVDYLINPRQADFNVKMKNRRSNY